MFDKKFLIIFVIVILLIISVIILYSRKENFHFEVSPMRKLGMLQGVLPIQKTPQDGITCPSEYVGYNGIYPMNVGNWPYRADGYTNGAPSDIPPTESCGTGSCSVMCNDKDVEQMYNKGKLLPNFDKSIQKDMKNYIVEQYDEMDNKSKIKDLDIVMYYNDNCGFCRITKEMLKQEGVDDMLSYINANQNGLPDGVKGVPYFVSKKTGKNKVGAARSLNDLIVALKSDDKESYMNEKEQLENLKVKMYYSDNCIFCQKMKDLLDSKNLLSSIQLVDIKDSGMPENAQGIPFFLSEKTTKTHTGFVPDVEVLIDKLSIKENYGTTTIMPNFLKDANLDIMGLKPKEEMPDRPLIEEYDNYYTGYGGKYEYNKYQSNYYKYDNYNNLQAEVKSTLANCGEDKIYKGDFTYEGFKIVEKPLREDFCYSGKCPLKNYGGKVDIAAV